MKWLIISAQGIILLAVSLPASAAGPGAHLGDQTTHGGIITEGSPNVLIGGAPAARMTDYATCPQSTGLIPHIGGDISSGSNTVFINGLPAARLGDFIIENGAVSNIAIGTPGVIIGD